MSTFTHFTPGDRVIAPGTTGHSDRAIRDGGPGTVVRIAGAGPLEQYIHIQLDSRQAGLTVVYTADEIKREPTI